MRHNHVAVIVSVLVAMLLGFVWYSPILFGELWRVSLGMTQEQVYQAGLMEFVIAIVSSFVAAYFMSWLIQRLAIRRNGWHGAALGVAVWLGLAVPTIATHYAFDQLQLTTFLVDAGDSLISLAVIGLMLAVWRKAPVGADAAAD